MDLDPGILCFTHCSTRIFCFNVPQRCLVCQLSLSGDIFPFRVPYPFVRPAQHLCSVVIKTTDGSFLRDYKDQDDLHIGVTSSRGVLYEYDHRGLTIGSAPSSWDQSLVVFKESLQDRFTFWDERLEKLAQQPLWTTLRYSELNFNCYDFVLAFLQTLDGVREDIASTKTGFIEKCVSPTIFKALKYVKLYRQVCHEGFYVSELGSEQDA